MKWHLAVLVLLCVCGEVVAYEMPGDLAQAWNDAKVLDPSYAKSASVHLEELRRHALSMKMHNNMVRKMKEAEAYEQLKDKPLTHYTELLENPAEDGVKSYPTLGLPREGAPFDSVTEKYTMDASNPGDDFKILPGMLSFAAGLDGRTNKVKSSHVFYFEYAIPNVYGYSDSDSTDHFLADTGAGYHMMLPHGFSAIGMSKCGFSAKTTFVSSSSQYSRNINIAASLETPAMKAAVPVGIADSTLTDADKSVAMVSAECSAFKVRRHSVPKFHPMFVDLFLKAGLVKPVFVADPSEKFQDPEFPEGWEKLKKEAELPADSTSELEEETPGVRRDSPADDEEGLAIEEGEHPDYYGAEQMDIDMPRFVPGNSILSLLQEHERLFSSRRRDLNARITDDDNRLWMGAVINFVNICPKYLQNPPDSFDTESSFCQMASTEIVNRLFANCPDPVLKQNFFMQLFNDFGTHVLKQAELGGQLSMTTSLSSSALSDSHAVSVAIESSFSGASGAESEPSKFKESVAVPIGKLNADAQKAAMKQMKDYVDEGTAKEASVSLSAVDDITADDPSNSGGGGAGGSKGSSTSTSSMINKSSIFVKGGTPGSFTPGAWGAWAATVSKMPVPIKPKYQNICEVLPRLTSEQYFSDSFEMPKEKVQGVPEDAPDAVYYRYEFASDFLETHVNKTDTDRPVLNSGRVLTTSALMRALCEYRLAQYLPMNAGLHTPLQNDNFIITVSFPEGSSGQLVWDQLRYFIQGTYSQMDLTLCPIKAPICVFSATEGNMRSVSFSITSHPLGSITAAYLTSQTSPWKYEKAIDSFGDAISVDITNTMNGNHYTLLRDPKTDNNGYKGFTKVQKLAQYCDHLPNSKEPEKEKVNCRRKISNYVGRRGAIFRVQIIYDKDQHAAHTSVSAAIDNSYQLYLQGVIGSHTINLNVKGSPSSCFDTYATVDYGLNPGRISFAKLVYLGTTPIYIKEVRLVVMTAKPSRTGGTDDNYKTKAYKFKPPAFAAMGMPTAKKDGRGPVQNLEDVPMKDKYEALKKKTGMWRLNLLAWWRRSKKEKKMGADYLPVITMPAYSLSEGLNVGGETAVV